jgi:hypothetical protein
MTSRERLHRLIDELPEQLTAKAEHVLRLLRDEEPEQEYVCPHCGQREHVLNEETIQALEDSKDPRNWIHGADTEDLFRKLGI